MCVPVWGWWKWRQWRHLDQQCQRGLPAVLQWGLSQPCLKMLNQGEEAGPAETSYCQKWHVSLLTTFLDVEVQRRQAGRRVLPPTSLLPETMSSVHLMDGIALNWDCRPLLETQVQGLGGPTTA